MDRPNDGWFAGQPKYQHAQRFSGVASLLAHLRPGIGLNLGYSDTTAPPREVNERHGVGEVKEISEVPAALELQDVLSTQLIDLVIAELSRGWSLPGKRVLDVASGAGVGSRALAAAGARAIPVDRMCYPGSTASLQASALELPVRTSWCDAAISVESASHLADRETFFAEVSRCLRPKARFVLADIVPDRDHQKVQEQLTRAGLVPVEIHDVTLGVVRALELRRQAFGHNGDLANFVAARVSAQELVAWNIDLDSLAVEAKLHRANRRMLERETLHYLIISCTRTIAGAD